MREHVLTFDDDGTVGCIADEEIFPLLRVLTGAQAKTQRASDVDPTEDLTGHLVHIRPWVPGGAVTLGPFPTRAAALAAEVAYLHEKGL